MVDAAGRDVPDVLAAWMQPFGGAFTAPTWRHVLVLVMGAILVPGRRTVASALRVMGLEQVAQFCNYHRVLNRNIWSCRWLSRRLFRLLVDAFVSDDDPVVIGLDDTIERRWGARIKARGIYRDPVRSSRGHFVKASGLRWLSLMLLPEIPWAGRCWALPFLTVLAPSERYWQEHKPGQRQYKKLTDWGRQVLIQAALWLPHRRIIGVGDASFAAIDLLNDVRPWVTMITRLRLDAALHKPAPKRVPGKAGRPPVVGKRQPTLKQRLVNPKTRWRRLLVTDGTAAANGCRDHLCHRRVEPSRSTRSHPLCLGTRPGGRTRAASLSLHRPRCRPAQHSTLVRPPLVDRGHLRRSPSPPRG